MLTTMKKFLGLLSLRRRRAREQPTRQSRKALSVPEGEYRQTEGTPLASKA
jgi:hypothetical protein